MINRTFLLFVLVAVFLGLPKPSAADARPNILFAFADDLGRYASVYGQLEPGTVNDTVNTPHIDRLAHQGVLFTNAFVSSPSCTPCRSSLLTGQHFWRTGSGSILHGRWDDTLPSYPLLLQDAGYHIGFSYKAWGPGTPSDAPFGPANKYQSAGKAFNSFSQQVMRSKDPQARQRELLEEVRQNFRAFIDARDGRAPFCYWFGPTNTHRKWASGSAQAIWGIDPDDLKGKLPAPLPDAPVVRQDFADYLGEVQAFDAGLGVLLSELEALGELDNTIIVVSGDHGIPGFPNAKCNLYDLGSSVPLVVRWGARAKPGRVVTDFVSLPDLAPTFLEAGGVRPPQVMTGRSLMALLASDSAGRIDPDRDHVVIGRERHVDTARPGNLPYPQRALRTDGFLYIRNFEPQRYPMGVGPAAGLDDATMPSKRALLSNNRVAYADLDEGPTKAFIVLNKDQDADSARHFDLAFGLRPAEELYDLKADPQQVHNVAEDPAYAATKARLAHRLMSILQATDDPRVSDDVVFEKPPFTDKRR